MTVLHITDTIKMLRETFCVAQGAIAKSAMEEPRWREHIQRIQRLIDECDLQRPLGPDGKHGNLHTTTCGCVDGNPRIDRLKAGNWQFGCDGQHHGIGTPECPTSKHHHHDMFCPYPTVEELRAAGVDPAKFRPQSRA